MRMAVPRPTAPISRFASDIQTNANAEQCQRNTKHDGEQDDK